MIGTIFRILVSAFFLGLLFLVLRDDIPGIISALKAVDPWLLAVGCLFMFLVAALLSLRLNLVFKAEHMPALKITEAFNVTFIGLFFNNFLPTSIGGDLVKAYCVSSKTGDKMKAFSGVIMDRVFALMIFVVIPSVTVLFPSDAF